MSINSLNPEQRQAACYIGGPLLVLAGAGSGKTRVITQKISWLIRETGLAAHHIAAVTFTNKAATEMKERLRALHTNSETRGIFIGTFHALGLKILRQSVDLVGLRSGFAICDSHDVHTMLKEHSGEDASWISQQISQWKNNLLTPQQVQATAQGVAEQHAAEVYSQYQRQLLAYNAVDFDDLILLPYQLFSTQEAVLSQWQRKIRYLLVDEYQDTNSCQYQLIRLLVGIRGALTVVGDDDQSIYAWRGARPENLQQLANDYPTLKIIKLEQNYRSGKRILRVANQLIAHNAHLFEKVLWSQLPEGNPIRIIQCKQATEEAEKIASEIPFHRLKHQAKYKDYAILYRGNHQSRLFEQALRQRDIPYRISGSTAFFQLAEVKDISCYLRIISNPADDVALLRVINVPRREIGASTLEKLAAYAAERKIHLLAACDEIGIVSKVGEKAAERLQQFAAWCRKQKHMAEQAKGTELSNLPDAKALSAWALQMMENLTYEDWIYQQQKDRKAGERRMQNVHDLLDWVGRMRAEPGERLTLDDVVAKLSLFSILEQNEEKEESDEVTLMTIHSAKGLEFPYVFLPGLEEDILPHKNSIDAGSIEEERRLLYVGITRAQRELMITFTEKRKRFGEWESCLPSRFLDELPTVDLQWEGERYAPDPQQQKEIGLSALELIKAQLKNGG